MLPGINDLTYTILLVDDVTESVSIPGTRCFH